MLDSGVWTELISKSDEWDVHFAVPVVVVQEAVSVVRRKWQKIRGAVAKEALAELGLAESQQSILEHIGAKIARYPDDQSGRLEEYFAEVVPIPESVDILEIAQRAIDDRAPFPGEPRMACVTR
jgi:hypothetical protein